MALPRPTYAERLACLKYPKDEPERFPELARRLASSERVYCLVHGDVIASLEEICGRKLPVLPGGTQGDYFVVMSSGAACLPASARSP